MVRGTIGAHFELYALRDGRWVMEACYVDEVEARSALHRLELTSGIDGVRLCRQTTYPGLATTTTVIVDTFSARLPDAAHEVIMISDATQTGD